VGQEAQLSPFAVLRLIYSRPHVIVQPSLGSLLAVISEQVGSTLHVIAFDFLETLDMLIAQHFS
jgi:hypothetical protein